MLKHCEGGCFFFMLTMMFGQTQPKGFFSSNQMTFLWCLNPTQHLCGLTSPLCDQTMESALRRGETAQPTGKTYELTLNKKRCEIVLTL